MASRKTTSNIPALKDWNCTDSHLDGCKAYTFPYRGTVLQIDPVVKAGKIQYKASTMCKNFWEIHDTFPTRQKCVEFFQQRHAK